MTKQRRLSKRDAVTHLFVGFAGQMNSIVIPRPYIDFCSGDHMAALLLSQILYWADRTDDVDGWFFKSYPEWNDELSLSESQVKRIVFGDKRSKAGFPGLKFVGIETEIKASKYHNDNLTTCYRVNTEILGAAIRFFIETGNPPSVLMPATPIIDLQTPPLTMLGGVTMQGESPQHCSQVTEISTETLKEPKGSFDGTLSAPAETSVPEGESNSSGDTDSPFAPVFSYTETESGQKYPAPPVAPIVNNVTSKPIEATPALTMPDIPRPGKASPVAPNTPSTATVKLRKRPGKANPVTNTETDNAWPEWVRSVLRCFNLEEAFDGTNFKDKRLGRYIAAASDLRQMAKLHNDQFPNGKRITFEDVEHLHTLLMKKWDNAIAEQVTPQTLVGHFTKYMMNRPETEAEREERIQREFDEKIKKRQEAQALGLPEEESLY